MAKAAVQGVPRALGDTALEGVTGGSSDIAGLAGAMAGTSTGIDLAMFGLFQQQQPMDGVTDDITETMDGIGSYLSDNARTA